MGLSPARRLAFKVVKRVREKDSFATEALQSAVARAKLSARDKAFATRLAYGTISVRGTLDELVATELSRPNDTPDELKDALALAAYELFFEGTEPYIVVDQGVELAYFAMKSKTYRGLANAVLRRLSEARDELFPGGNPLQDVQAAARYYGHPLWLAELLREQYGAELANEVMAINNEPAPLYVAHLPFFESEHQSLTTLGKFGVAWSETGIEGAFLIEDRAKFWGLDPDYRRSFVAMDLAAQQVVAFCKAHPDQNILEVGSGRGTKSLALAAAARRLGGPAKITGVDLYEFKTKVAQKTAQGYHAQECDFLTLDVTKRSAIDRLREHCATEGASEVEFDTVLVDAPCSGLGTLRRAVDKRWKLKPEDIEALSKLGLNMLKWASACVRPGGALIYATCTISREENQDVVQAFLGLPEGQDFAIEATLLDELAPAFAEAITSEGYLNALPQSEGPDGHFAVRLRRTER